MQKYIEVNIEGKDLTKKKLIEKLNEWEIKIKSIRESKSYYVKLYDKYVKEHFDKVKFNIYKNPLKGDSERKNSKEAKLTTPVNKETDTEVPSLISKKRNRETDYAAVEEVNPFKNKILINSEQIKANNLKIKRELLKNSPKSAESLLKPNSSSKVNSTDSELKFNKLTKKDKSLDSFLNKIVSGASSNKKSKSRKSSFASSSNSKKANKESKDKNNNLSNSDKVARPLDLINIQNGSKKSDLSLIKEDSNENDISRHTNQDSQDRKGLNVSRQILNDFISVGGSKERTPSFNHQISKLNRTISIEKIDNNFSFSKASNPTGYNRNLDNTPIATRLNMEVSPMSPLQPDETIRSSHFAQLLKSDSSIIKISTPTVKSSKVIYREDKNSQVKDSLEYSANINRSNSLKNNLLPNQSAASNKSRAYSHIISDAYNSETIQKDEAYMRKKSQNLNTNYPRLQRIEPEKLKRQLSDTDMNILYNFDEENFSRPRTPNSQKSSLSQTRNHQINQINLNRKLSNLSSFSRNSANSHNKILSKPFLSDSEQSRTRRQDILNENISNIVIDDPELKKKVIEKCKGFFNDFNNSEELNINFALKYFIIGISAFSALSFVSIFLTNDNNLVKDFIALINQGGSDLTDFFKKHFIWFLVAVCLAALILAYIDMKNHEIRDRQKKNLVDTPNQDINKYNTTQQDLIQSNTQNQYIPTSPLNSERDYAMQDYYTYSCYSDPLNRSQDLIMNNNEKDIEQGLPSQQDMIQVDNDTVIRPDLSNLSEQDIHNIAKDCHQFIKYEIKEKYFYVGLADHEVIAMLESNLNLNLTYEEEFIRNQIYPILQEMLDNDKELQGVLSETELVYKYIGE